MLGGQINLELGRRSGVHLQNRLDPQRWEFVMAQAPPLPRHATAGQGWVMLGHPRLERGAGPGYSQLKREQEVLGTRHLSPLNTRARRRSSINPPDFCRSEGDWDDKSLL